MYAPCCGNHFWTAHADPVILGLTMRLLTRKPFRMNTQRHFFSVHMFFVALFLLTLCGCASIKDMFDFSGDKKADVHLPVETLIAKGLDEFNIGRYYLADTYFTEG